MGLIGETSGVFKFLRDLWYFLPVAIRLLIVGAFGSVVFFSILLRFRG